MVQSYLKGDHAMLISVGSERRQMELRQSVGRSEFQTQVVAQLWAQDAVDYFMENPICDEPYKGPFTLHYKGKDGRTHAIRIGQQEVLGHTAKRPGSPRV
jgi:hypothetical protein